MGLDMYLNAKRFLWSNEDELAETLTKAFPELNGKEMKVSEVIVEAAYWRKANAIHKWFVENVQDGEDNCGHYEVSREQLTELRDLVVKALKDKDASLLPPTSGFFFGGTEIDEWYWSYLKSTVKQLDNVLDTFNDSSGWWLEYHSSW